MLGRIKYYTNRDETITEQNINVATGRRRVVLL